MPHWGPHFQPDPNGDFVLNMSPERATYLPPAPTLGRRVTTPSRPRPSSFHLSPAAAVEVRSPLGISQGQTVALETRSPQRSAHQRSLSTNFRSYDVSPRVPTSPGLSRSPGWRSPRIIQDRSPRPESMFLVRPQYYDGFPIPDTEPITETRKPSFRPTQIHASSTPLMSGGLPEIRRSYSSDDDEQPRVTVAETHRRNRREREYREVANRRRAAGRAPPERDEEEEEEEEDYSEFREDDMAARDHPRRTSASRSSASASRDADYETVAPRMSSRRRRESQKTGHETLAKTRSKPTEITRTREYLRTYERERSRRSRDSNEPLSKSRERSTYSRSPSQAVRSQAGSSTLSSPVSVNRPRAQTLKSPSPSRNPEGMLLLEDATADRAKHLVEERAIFGRGGKKTTQYHYA